MSQEIINLAKRINAGESGNHRSKAEWYRVTKAMAEEQRQAGETSEQSFSRFVTMTDDGKELYKAMKSADGPDFEPPAPKPVLVSKSDSAYGRLKKLAADLRADQPELSEQQAFAKVFVDPKHRDLAEESKRENAFA
jgi:hypothetical protein